MMHVSRLRVVSFPFLRHLSLTEVICKVLRISPPTCRPPTAPRLTRFLLVSGPCSSKRLVFILLSIDNIPSEFQDILRRGLAALYRHLTKRSDLHRAETVSPVIISLPRLHVNRRRIGERTTHAAITCLLRTSHCSSTSR